MLLLGTCGIGLHCGCRPLGRDIAVFSQVVGVNTTGFAFKCPNKATAALHTDINVDFMLLGRFVWALVGGVCGVGSCQLASILGIGLEQGLAVAESPAFAVQQEVSDTTSLSSQISDNFLPGTVCADKQPASTYG